MGDYRSVKGRSAIRLFNKFPHNKKEALGESFLGKRLLCRYGWRK